MSPFRRSQESDSLHLVHGMIRREDVEDLVLRVLDDDAFTGQALAAVDRGDP